MTLLLAPLLALFLSLGCATDPALPPTSDLGFPTDTSAPKVSTLLGDAPGIVFTGEWTSAGCGGRAYPRNLVLVANGTYAGIDLVSPCPSGATCAWSGIAGFAGVWKQEGKKVLLREIGGPIARGSPHPTEIESTVDGHLVENGCLYDRGLTIPAGYVDDQVRPRVPGTY